MELIQNMIRARQTARKGIFKRKRNTYKQNLKKVLKCKPKQRKQNGKSMGRKKQMERTEGNE